MLLLAKMKRWVIRDNIYRNLYKKNEVKKIVLKSLLYNEVISYDYKMYFDKKFKKFTFKSSISKNRTYCLFLGNNRSIFKKFKMSRDIFKKYGSNGFLIGLRKASF